MKQSALLDGVLRYFRSRRMRKFEKMLGLTPQTRVLDVGGSSAIWNLVSIRPRVTLLNLPSAVEPDRKSDELRVAGDGCLLPFRDRSFDIVFSNSVIEHVGGPENQRRFAAEVARVGCRYWIQTPNRSAPFEMHVMLPFVHLLPKSWQFAIIGRFSVWELLAKPTPAQKAHFYNHVIYELHLLNQREFQALFPDALILNERLLGFPKSLLAVRLENV